MKKILYFYYTLIVLGMLFPFNSSGQEIQFLGTVINVNGSVCTPPFYGFSFCHTVINCNPQQTCVGTEQIYFHQGNLSIWADNPDWAGTTFSWLFNDDKYGTSFIEVPLGDAETVFHPVWNTPGDYMVIGIMMRPDCPYGSEGISYVTEVTVFPLPEPIISILSSGPFCPDDEIILDRTYTSNIPFTDIIQETWDFGDGSVAYYPLPIGGFLSPVYQYGYAGNYLVTLTSINTLQCISTATINITVECCDGIYKHDTWPTSFEASETWEPGRKINNNDYSASNNKNPFKSEDGNVYFDSDVSIPAGKTLLIKNMTLHFDANKSLTLEAGSGSVKGAHLILSNSTLTSYDQCGENDVRWNGVIVQGNNSSQYPATSTKQTKLVLIGTPGTDGSVIENAYYGAEITYGGIIHANNSTIRNNFYGIKFSGFFNNSGSYASTNASYFTRCHFITDKTNLNNNSSTSTYGEYPMWHVFINYCNGVRFNANIFENTTGRLVLERGKGINAYHSSISVEALCEVTPPVGSPCTQFIRSEFKNLEYGIKAMACASVNVDKVYFQNNHRGILAEYMPGGGLSVTSSEFKVGTSTTGSGFTNVSYGLYLNECHAYTIEENEFYNGKTGMLINESGAGGNIIYRNSFSQFMNGGNSTSVIVLGRNGNFFTEIGLPGQIGLQVKCNTFDGNFHNTAVLDNPYASEMSTIAKQQGNPVSTQDQSNELAGNSFFNRYPDSEAVFYTQSQLTWNGSSYRYKYLRHGEDPLDASDDFVKLVYYDQAKIEEIAFQMITYHESEACLSNIAGPKKTIAVIGNQLMEANNTITTKTAVLNTGMDGGNTPELLAKVETIKPKNYAVICDELAGTEFLSDKVLMAFMRNGFRGQPTKKAAVLLAHSPLPEAGQNELDATWLPKNFKDQVIAAQTGTSAREILEMEIAAAEMEKQSLLADAVQLAMNSDTIDLNDSLIELLELQGDYGSKLLLVSVLVNVRQFDQARAKLAELQGQLPELSLILQEDLARFIEVENLAIDVREQPDQLATVVNDNLTFLTDLAGSYRKGFVQAQLLLEEACIANYDELILLPPETQIQENLVINGVLVENSDCGSSPIEGYEIALIDLSLEPVQGVTPVVTLADGSLSFDYFEVNRLDHASQYAFATTNGFDLQQQVFKTLYEWLVDANIQLGITNIHKEWANAFHGMDSLTDIGTAIDLNGNIYVGGQTYTPDHGVDFVVLKYDASGNLLWNAFYDGLGNSDDLLRSLTVDQSGNCYVTGSTRNAAGNPDYLTLKYSADGVLLWSAIYNGTSALYEADNAVSIALDDQNNVLVTGYSTGVSSQDIVTIKYDNNGNTIWLQRYDSQGADEFAVDMKVAGSNVYVAGYSNTGTNIIYALLKYDGTGNLLWSQQYDHGVKDMAAALTVDDLDNVFITGTSWGASYDMATLKYSADGTLLWERRYNSSGNGDDHAYALIGDGIGGIYIAGTVGQDMNTLRYDASGVLLWESSFNGVNNGVDRPYSVGIDEGNNLYIAGFSTIANAGKAGDIATLKYNDLGELIWAETYNHGFGNVNWGYNIAVSPNNNVYVTGFVFNGTNQDIITIKYAQCASTAALKSFSGEEHAKENTSGSEMKESTTISLYPNPNDGNMQLDYYFEESGDGIFVIYTLQGKQVSTYSLRENNHHVFINNNELENGLYFYRVIQGSETIENGKLMIVK